ncbi:histidinol dehydrogenase [Nitritalea halalkaliphila LW7]|uniref:Histidinol dehydrogenase n=1 Tax=Nitritalea halalkaliphila LW7 TaxID=1189621 RepID=I5C9S7_9BACT|nr:histidinol dehydrogenase [Nitritalea halalkaliphila LW7]
MKIFIHPARKEWGKLLARPVQKTKDIEKVVKPIFKKVKRQGDKALIKLALEYDHVAIEELLVRLRSSQRHRDRCRRRYRRRFAPQRPI